MEFATGALGTLLPKLGQLLRDEYYLHKDAKKNIEFLTSELESIRAALRDVGEFPPEQLSEVVKVWARDAREVSYDMEDIVDTFLVRVQDPAKKLPSKRSAKKFIKKMVGFVTKAKARHDIGQEIKDIKERVKEIAERRDR
jgi:disease resistance protein RPM1